MIRLEKNILISRMPKSSFKGFKVANFYVLIVSARGRGENGKYFHYIKDEPMGDLFC
jgi:hypothetical protein